MRLSTSLLLLFSFVSFQLSAQSYKIVYTDQTSCYDNHIEISAPSASAAFYGQDAQVNGHQPSHTDNGDGTITDNITGLMWQKSPDQDGDGDIDANDKLSYSNALSRAQALELAGYSDWRLPSIKELYSLIMFYGQDPSGYTGTSTDGLVPFINTDYFDFGYGDTNAGERLIDAQFASSTLYVGTTMAGDETLFGVNFADGRIKGYGLVSMAHFQGATIPSGRRRPPAPSKARFAEDKSFYVLFVRGNSEYGMNDFDDNKDGTITDRATGLMWTQSDNGTGLTWQEALAWVQQKNAETYLGYSDWRLPNVKELQSIVDYTRSPQTTNSPAIDPLFQCTAITDEGGDNNYPFYWSSTTHANMRNGANAAYVAFGEGLGWMQSPTGYNLLDVHGAGCQRSDPKSGDPNDYPHGFGPQGDVIRIYNFVRLVRDAKSTTDIGERENTSPQLFKLGQNYPNPFNPTTTIPFYLENNAEITLAVYNARGQKVTTLQKGFVESGRHTVQFYGKDLPSGFYLSKLENGNNVETRNMILKR